MHGMAGKIRGHAVTEREVTALSWKDFPSQKESPGPWHFPGPGLHITGICHSRVSKVVLWRKIELPSSTIVLNMTDTSNRV